MYDQAFFFKLANNQIRHQATHKVGCQPGDLHMVISIFLWGVSGYIWSNILTYDP